MIGNKNDVSAAQHIIRAIDKAVLEYVTTRHFWLRDGYRSYDTKPINLRFHGEVWLDDWFSIAAAQNKAPAEIKHSPLADPFLHNSRTFSRVDIGIEKP